MWPFVHTVAAIQQLFHWGFYAVLGNGLSQVHMYFGRVGQKLLL